MRVMGLDFGDKTIGVAVSDPMGLTAQGRGVVRRKNLTVDLQQLRDYIEKYNVDKIIVGLPVNMDGSLGPRAEKTEQFVNFLKKRVDIPVEFWDERLSSREAERALISVDMSRDRRKKVIDQVAASIILQSYLNSQDIRP